MSGLPEAPNRGSPHIIPPSDRGLSQVSEECGIFYTMIKNAQSEG